MGSRLKRTLLTAILLTSLASSVPSSAQKDDSQDTGDLRYLLVRRAGSPERNYYELSRTARFLEPQRLSDEMVGGYKPSPRNYGFDIETEFTVRYGVYQAWKVRVVGTSDSAKAPNSAKESVYVLIYPRDRNPDWTFCARKYRVVSGKAARVIYTDFQDGKEHTVELSSKWKHPWQVSEIEILNSNAFVEIWEASKHSQAGRGPSTPQGLHFVKYLLRSG
jgi:hypothetical protein